MNPPLWVTIDGAAYYRTKQKPKADEAQAVILNDKSVERAAVALQGCWAEEDSNGHEPMLWAALALEDQDHWRDWARAALSAALPEERP